MGFLIIQGSEAVNLELNLLEDFGTPFEQRFFWPAMGSVSCIQGVGGHLRFRT